MTYETEYQLEEAIREAIGDSGLDLASICAVLDTLLANHRDLLADAKLEER